MLKNGQVWWKVLIESGKNLEKTVEKPTLFPEYHKMLKSCLYIQ